jgi:hypothetical protein
MDLTDMDLWGCSLLKRLLDDPERFIDHCRE